jgi:hypothetical protein
MREAEMDVGDFGKGIATVVDPTACRAGLPATCQR